MDLYLIVSEKHNNSKQTPTQNEKRYLRNRGEVDQYVKTTFEPYLKGVPTELVSRIEQIPLTSSPNADAKYVIASSSDIYQLYNVVTVEKGWIRSVKASTLVLLCEIVFLKLVPAFDTIVVQPIIESFSVDKSDGNDDYLQSVSQKISEFNATEGRETKIPILFEIFDMIVKHPNGPLLSNSNFRKVLKRKCIHFYFIDQVKEIGDYYEKVFGEPITNEEQNSI